MRSGVTRDYGADEEVARVDFVYVGTSRVDREKHIPCRFSGVEVTDVQEFDWGSFVFFSDPDGNGWAVQQVPARR